MGLECPFCGHIWQPKVPNPVACPKCKRYFTVDKQAGVADYEPQEKVKLPVEASVPRLDSPNPSAYVQCYRGQRFGDCGERAIIKIGKHSYCYEHAIEELQRLQAEIEPGEEE